ncbi:MAG: hypothetical protein FWF44_10890 [Defluviitaleaceae bacterium]|nr:hypothetical protein [Defluviitaleaceae bacterium]
MNEFVLNLKTLQGERSVTAFSRFLGVNQKTLDNYIKGIRRPTVGFLLNVRAKCGVSLDALMGLEGAVLPPQCQPDVSAALAEKDGIIAGQQAMIDSLAASVRDAAAAVRELTATNARLVAGSEKKGTTRTSPPGLPSSSIQTASPFMSQPARQRHLATAKT